MLSTTAGRLLVNEALPPELRRYDRILNRKEAKKLFQEMADKYPDKYRQISHELLKIGGRAAYETGGFSFGLEHLKIPTEVVASRDKLRKEVWNIVTDKSMTDDARDKAIIDLMGQHAKPLQEQIYQAALKAKNPLAMQIESGAKGSEANLMGILAGDLLYEGHKGQPIPYPVLHSFSEGYKPAEYWASTYGVRKGLIDLKLATQDAGYFGKQLNRVTHRLIVTKHDADKPEEHLRGFPVDTDDADNEGALLAHPMGGYKRNTVLTPEILAELTSKGHERILIRSPITGGPPEGGLYAADIGVRERGGMAPIGDYVGMAAAQALSEPVTQSQISSKHLGGVAGAGQAISGFKYINQLVQVPKVFGGGAAHAELDGRVGAIFPAPAGGSYVMIGSERHYIPRGQQVTVKPGDSIEAGDMLSDGLPNPAKITEHKGIGEGRRYFVKALRDVYTASGIRAHRRNLELLSRGLINHVRLTDEMGDYTPDDIVPYDVLEHNYRPRDGHNIATPKRMVGWHLEKPVLHYSVGTKIKPSMLNEFERFGVKSVVAHPDPPPFQPEMIRAEESLQHDPDWMARMMGANLKKSLLTASHRGLASDEKGTSFVAPLARSLAFGREGLTKGRKVEPGMTSLGGVPAS